MPDRFRLTGEPWRVGVLFSQTGCTSNIERTQLFGTILAIEEINAAGGVLGREIVPVIYEPGLEPLSYAFLAKKLITEDRVSTIFGSYTSASRKAIVPVVERFNGLLWYPTPYEGFESSPNVIYTGASPSQSITSICPYLMKRYGPRFFLVGSDYVYPRLTNRFLKDYLSSRGGVVIAEQYVNMLASRWDFLSVARAIRDLRADVVFSTVVGDGTSYLYQAFAEVGLNPWSTPIASLTTTEAEVRAMGCDVGEAHFTAASYFDTVQSEASASFVARFRKRFDAAAVNVCAETAYSQVYLFAQALAQAGTLETDVLRPLILGSSFEAPQGRIRISSTGHADVWTRIGRANRNGSFDLVAESPTPALADPFFMGGAADFAT